MNNSDIPRSQNTVWFCRAYQRNKCKSKENPHLGTLLNSNQVSFSHICATCWLKDKAKLGHPESSTACPNFDN